MINTPLFRKYYFIFLAIFLCALLVALAGSFAVNSIARSMATSMTAENTQRMLGPPRFFRRVVALLHADPRTAVKILNQNNQDPFIDLLLIDRQGKAVEPAGAEVPGPITSDLFEKLERGETAVASSPRNDGGPPAFALTSTNDPGYFLMIIPKPMPGMRPPNGPLGPPPGFERGGPRGPPPIPQGPFLVTLIAILAAIFVATGLALFFLFSSYKQRAATALEILARLKQGDLRARMPVAKFDEIAPLVRSFNVMADEVEHLVESLRRSDQSRRRLLQDLAHDLRTPLASLTTFLEALDSSGEKIPAEKRAHILSLCRVEVSYFSRLVEDLLFLAQMTEPKYARSTEKVDLISEIDNLKTIFVSRAPHLRYASIFEPIDGLFEVPGSEALIERLLRNAIDNSSSFARESVVIRVTQEDSVVRVIIDDDGPGFTPKALEEFGHKRATRELRPQPSGQRISLGIGSVIMKEIAHLHGGSVTAENRLIDGTVAGARLTVTLPRA